MKELLKNVLFFGYSENCTNRCPVVFLFLFSLRKMAQMMLLRTLGMRYVPHGQGCNFTSNLMHNPCMFKEDLLSSIKSSLQPWESSRAGTSGEMYTYRLPAFVSGRG